MVREVATADTTVLGAPEIPDDSTFRPCDRCGFWFVLPLNKTKHGVKCRRCRGGNSLTRKLVDYHLSGSDLGKDSDFNQAVRIIINYFNRKSPALRMPNKDGTPSHPATFDYIAEWIREHFVECAAMPHDELLALCRGNEKPPFCFWASACLGDAKNDLETALNRRRLEREKLPKGTSNGQPHVKFDPVVWLHRHWDLVKGDMEDQAFAVLAAVIEAYPNLNTAEDYRQVVARAVRESLNLSTSQAKKRKAALVAKAQLLQSQDGPLRDLALELIGESLRSSKLEGTRGTSDDQFGRATES